MVYAMALHADATTDACAAPASPVLPYLEQLFERDIVHMTADLSCARSVVTPVYTEWLARLQHRHFGLSTFFIAQNATQKLGIRIVPSIHAALAAGEAPSTFVAFAIAAMLRFLTPIGEQPRIDEPRPVFVGRRSTAGRAAAAQQYAPGLTVDLAAGSYEFADANGLVPLLLRPLGRPAASSAVAVASITKQVLTAIDGLFARTDAPIVALVGRVADLLRRMLGGEGACDVLHSLDPSQPLLIPPAKLRDAVGQEVDAAEAIDVHAHCFAAEYGDKLMAFGVDKLLTAGYGDADLACSPDLVAQYLAISDDTPDAFAALPVEEQANRVWRALFVERSPLSEACLGVVTTLEALGLHSEVEARDLGAVRRWYATQDGAKFNEKVMRLAKLRYVVSSHSPFFSSVQLGACLRPPPPPPRYRAALEVDSLLEGDWARVIATLDAAGEPRTLRGVSQLLERCLAGLGAHAVEYISCSTPHTFTYDAVPASARKRRGSDRAHAWPVGADGPIAATSASSTLPPAPKRRAMPPVSPARASTFDEAEDGFDGGEPASPTSPGSLAAMNATLDMGLAPAPPSSKDVLDAVLLPLCRKYGLPLLLRMGTARQMNADLRLAGDGVGSARLDALTKLCAAHPNVKFLVTVLDAAQQHAAAVIASRFRNVHCWGSWWFSALPSVAAESSKMRVEMLGTQFTFAASSAKLHDQLIYKWLHGRSLLTSVLTDRYAALAKHGWRVSRGDIRRDVNRLLGGAYEEFIQKKL